MSPSVVMLSVFSFSTFIAVLNVHNWQVTYIFESYLITITGLMTFFITECYFIVARKIDNQLGVDLSDYDPTVTTPRIIHVQLWKILCVVALGCVCLAWQRNEVMRIAVLGGYAGGDDMATIYRHIASYSTDLNPDEQMNSILNQLIKILDASAIVLAYIFINNVIVWKDKFFRNFPLIIPLFFHIAKELQGSSRGNIMKTIGMLTVCGYILCQKKAGWDKKLSHKFMRFCVIAMLLFLPLFYFASNIVGRQNTKTLFDYISFYAGGSIQHFNQYIQSPPPPNTAWGEEDFVSIYAFLWKHGLSNFHRIIHLEFRDLNFFVRGNIYTFFRRPIQDFGLFGMYIVVILTSAFFSFFYYNVIKRRKVDYLTDQLLIIYSYFFYLIYMSSIENYLFSYLNIGTIVMLVLFWFAMWGFTRMTWNIDRFRIIRYKKNNHATNRRISSSGI